MKRNLVAAALLLLVACSRNETERSPAREPASDAGFVDRVWTVVESPGGPGELYVFLSDGTFIKAAKDAVPDVGRWSWDGRQLTIVETALPYTADIDSLSGSYFGITIHFMNRAYRVGLAPAGASMPDTTRTVEFDPARARIIATGIGPAWVCEIENDRAELRMGGRTMYFAGGEWMQDCASVWDYSAHADLDGSEETLELQLSTATCRGDAGGESPLSVLLTRGEIVAHGCAVAGKLPLPRQ